MTYARSAAKAERASEAAFARIDELNHVFSEYDGDSELSRLNARTARHAGETRVSPELWSLLETAQRMAEATDGAFDVTVGPWVRLWRRAERQAALPAPARLAAAAAAIGHDKLHVIQPDRIRFEVPEMHITCGGIAKGFIADAALAVFTEHGLPASLVDAGGDIVVGDPPPARAGWKIAFDGDGSDDQPEYVEVCRCAIATSGDREQFVQIGSRRYSHVIDPRIGSRRGLRSTEGRTATVLARSGAVADALASAFVVLGPEGAAGVLAQFPGASAQILQVAGASVDVWRSPTLPVVCED